MTPHQNTDRLARLSPDAPSAGERPRRDRVAKYLVGAGSSAAELPPLSDLLAILVSLAEGTRRKAILPLASSTGEFAFVRRDEHTLVSYYDAGPVPQVFVRDRVVDLSALIEAAAEALREQSGADEAMVALADRAQRVTLKPAPHSSPSLVSRKGGALTAPGDAPLAFGFAIKLAAGDGHAMETGTRADVHALLFDGELWGFAHGRKVVLVRGPVFPAVARMVSAARSVVDAWEARKPVHLKLRAGEFGIALRIGRDGDARVTLVSKKGRIWRVRCCPSCAWPPS
jgi:hypothetical protein